MKKRAVIVIAAIMCILLFVGCCMHKWTPATCVEAKTCTMCGAVEGSPLGHSWRDATCTDPKTCTKCGETVGSALGHQWTEVASCSEPQTCKICGISNGKAGEHSWIAETETTPKMCRVCGEMVPKAKPKNGEILLKYSGVCDSELTINSAGRDSHFIKLKDQKENDVLSFFVQSGSNVTVKVPCGKYRVYFASGEDWYGTDYCFGDDTYYSKDDELLDFNTYTYEYTLYPVTSGNFEETPISEDEFK